MSIVPKTMQCNMQRRKCGTFRSILADFELSQGSNSLDQLLPSIANFAQLRASKIFHAFGNITAATRAEETIGDIAIL